MQGKWDHPWGVSRHKTGLAEPSGGRGCRGSYSGGGIPKKTETRMLQPEEFTGPGAFAQNV